ncbi:hypothetical protein Rsub_10779 [Raphidocelis subcapitata]|uniref:Protein CASP n=1 Tax=Raphidocelis subcapitata TaxID=307507 RepID=A0A2V0PEV9_9CHLO|nr:hypothetical protein Rsub_10779 [Raphidocelis subcapitata]|eukprot:GBF98384.1 hypothetical protein Rsub_10779 [Raphidocelis subcapitata]
MAAPLAPLAAFWREFDLDNKWRSKLDEVGLRIAELQEQSTGSRRALADTTKEWKRAAGEQGKVAAPLLKRYQEEVDALTKRARHAEGAYLELYQELYEAPDPSPALSAAAESEARASQLEAKVQKLSTELAEYKAESKAIKNQDLTIRKQEEAIRELQAALEAKSEELEAARREAAAEADAAVMAQMQAREAELTEMLASAQSSLEAMRRLHASAQNQLFELQARSEEAEAGKQFEFDQAAEEVERVQSRVAALEAEKRSLETRLQQRASEQPGAAGGSPVEEALRQELSAQRDVSARLRSDFAAARAALEEALSAAEARAEAGREQFEAAAERARGLEQELLLRPTQAQVEELKQQVRILQAVGYGAMDDGAAPSAGGDDGGGGGGDGGGEPGAAGSGGGGGSMGGAGSLEAALLSKNRRLEHDLTMARLAAAEREQTLEAAQSQLADAEARLSEREALIKQLEEDLLSGRAGGAPPPAPASGPAPLPAPALSASLDGGGGGGGEGGEDSLARVLAGQRDRLRARVKELEEQLAAARAASDAAAAALEAARADNVALVERLRYVGGYRQQAAARKDAAGPRGAASADVEAGGAGDVVGRYSQLYEERINPFKEFQGQQHEQKRRQMGVADKAMYSVGHLVYQSPAARLVAFVYLVAMHALVFASLARASHHTSDHLIEHTERALQHGHAARNDLTSLLTHDGTAGGAAAAAGAPVAAAAAAAAPKLLMRLFRL